MKNLYILRKKDNFILFNKYYQDEFKCSVFEEFSEEKVFLNPSSCLFSTNFKKLNNDLKLLKLNKNDVLILSLIDLIVILNKIRKG